MYVRVAHTERIRRRVLAGVQGAREIKFGTARENRPLTRDPSHPLNLRNKENKKTRTREKFFKAAYVRDSAVKESVVRE